MRLPETKTPRARSISQPEVPDTTRARRTATLTPEWRTSSVISNLGKGVGSTSKRRTPAPSAGGLALSSNASGAGQGMAKFGHNWSMLVKL